MDKNLNVQTLLITVGGSPEPIIKSIEIHNPETIIFFTSQDSYKIISSDILPAILASLGHIPPHEAIITPDHENVGISAFTLLYDMPHTLKKLHNNKKWADVVDYTAGTKPMSAAIIWASCKFPCLFSYIGSSSADGRTKNGLGIVISGREKCLQHENPWNDIAYYEVKEAITLFNNGQYNRAAEFIKQLQEKVTDNDRKQFLEIIYGIWHGYALWDDFYYDKANNEFKTHLEALIKYAPQKETLWPGIEYFTSETVLCSETINTLTERKGEVTWNKIYDIMANAYRRAKLGNKFNDAFIRCRIALNKYGIYALKLRHGITPEDIPGIITAYTLDNKDTISIYHKLAELNDPAGKRFIQCEKKLTTTLFDSENSIIGNGITSVGRNEFYILFNLTLQIMNLKENDLTIFPVLTKEKRKVL